MTVAGLSLTGFLFGLLVRHLAMSCRFLPASIGFSPSAIRGAAFGSFLVKEAVEYVKLMLGPFRLQPGNLFHRFAYMKTDIQIAGCAHQASTAVSGSDPAHTVLNTDSGPANSTASTSSTPGSSPASAR